MPKDSSGRRPDQIQVRATSGVGNGEASAPMHVPEICNIFDIGPWGKRGKWFRTLLETQISLGNVDDETAFLSFYPVHRAPEEPPYPPSTPTAVHQSSLASAGFSVRVEFDVPAIACATAPREIFGCADWDSLVSHAETYILCDCPAH
jgi:hypothetical protein